MTCLTWFCCWVAQTTSARRGLQARCKSFYLFGAQTQVPLADTISSVKACISQGCAPKRRSVEICLQAMHELAASWGAVVGVLALPRFVNPKVPDGLAFELRFLIVLAGGVG